MTTLSGSPVQSVTVEIGTAFGNGQEVTTAALIASAGQFTTEVVLPADTAAMRRTAVALLNAATALDGNADGTGLLDVLTLLDDNLADLAKHEHARTGNTVKADRATRHLNTLARALGYADTDALGTPIGG